MIPISRHHNTTHHGFTLIELALSIAFIGILSITIALIINDTIATYRRGLTLSQVNTVGMDLVDDMRAAIQNSSSKSLASECQSLYEETDDDNNLRGKCSTDGGKNLVSVTKYATVTIRNGTTLENAPVYGALCTGTYSYIWNSGYFFDAQRYLVGDNGNQSPATVKYKNSENTDITEGSTDNPFKLLKIEDKNRAVCAYSMSNGSVVDNTYISSDPLSGHNGTFDITESNEIISEKPVRLLAEDSNDTSLAIYNLEASAPVESDANNGMFYYISFILGTVDGGVNIMGKGNFCATPSDYEDANFDYCAINKFNFAAQATGV